jgi:hypothetical protein
VPGDDEGADEDAEELGVPNFFTLVGTALSSAFALSASAYFSRMKYSE